MEMTETYEHKYLKDIALIWLRDRGYLWIASEVYLPWLVPDFYRDSVQGFKQQTLGGVRKTWHNRDYIDVAGVRWKYDGYRRLWGCGIEVKVSREDYLSGFCHDRLNVTYIMAPRGLIPKKTLPERMGLIEVSDVTVNEFGELQGLRITKPAICIYHDFDLEISLKRMGRLASLKLARTLKKQLPTRRRPKFKTPKLEISINGS